MKTHEKRILAAMIIRIIGAIYAICLTFIPIFSVETPEEFGLQASVSVSMFDMIIGNVDKPAVVSGLGSEGFEYGEENFYEAITDSSIFETVMPIIIRAVYAIMVLAAVFSVISPQSRAIRVELNKGTPNTKKYFRKYVDLPSYPFMAFGIPCILAIPAFLIGYAIVSGDSENQLNWITLTILFAVLYCMSMLSAGLVRKYESEMDVFEEKYGCRPLFSAFYGTRENKESNKEVEAEVQDKTEIAPDKETKKVNESTKALSEDKKIELLEKYQDLLNKGIITKEEFDKKKAELLETVHK